MNESNDPINLMTIKKDQYNNYPQCKISDYLLALISHLICTTVMHIYTNILKHVSQLLLDLDPLPIPLRSTAILTVALVSVLGMSLIG